MELSTQTVSAIQSAYDWFVAGGDLTKEAEDTMSAYIRNIIRVSNDPTITHLAEECRDYWTGYCVTDVDLYPRLGRWRMNGMFGKLMEMAMKAELPIFDAIPEHGTFAPVVPVPETLSEEESSQKPRILET
jgi:hypothetical protein